MKKYLIIPIIFIILAATFAVISFLVFASKGKASLIKRKLRIGALLLTLTGTVLTVSSGCCYAMEEPAPIVTINNIFQNSQLNINLAETNILHGSISNIYAGTQFSFTIQGTNEIPCQKDNVYAIDGAIDEDMEEFTITLTNTIPTGQYSLFFYNSEVDSQYPYQIAMFYLNITND